MRIDVTTCLAHRALLLHIPIVTTVIYHLFNYYLTYTEYMSLLLLLTLLSNSPSAEKVPEICVDLTAILGEAVEDGYLTYKEAGDVIARCARAPSF